MAFIFLPSLNSISLWDGHGGQRKDSPSILRTFTEAADKKKLSSHEPIGKSATWGENLSEMETNPQEAEQISVTLEPPGSSHTWKSPGVFNSKNQYVPLYLNVNKLFFYSKPK